eukprot:3448109-Alexandrium_andersonii.AAC.1
MAGRNSCSSVNVPGGCWVYQMNRSALIRIAKSWIRSASEAADAGSLKTSASNKRHKTNMEKFLITPRFRVCMWSTQIKETDPPMSLANKGFRCKHRPCADDRQNRTSWGNPTMASKAETSRNPAKGSSLSPAFRCISGMSAKRARPLAPSGLLS